MSQNKVNRITGNTQALFFPQNITCKVRPKDRNRAQVHPEGDFSPAETPVNPRNAQLFPPDYHCCPEGETEKREGVRRRLCLFRTTGWQ